MINFTCEGGPIKMGLNLYLAKGGFVAAWAWYDIQRHEVIWRRFRLRMHIKPRILWESQRINVIEEYARKHNLEMVNREVLADLKETEGGQMKRMDEFSYLHRLDTSRGL